MESERTIEQQMADIATKLSTKYARTCWWAERAELEQEAWVVLLEFRTRWAPRDPATGEIDRGKFGNYAYRAVARQLSRWLWRQSSPVRLPDHACKAAVAGEFRRASLAAAEPWGNDDQGTTGFAPGMTPALGRYAW